MTLLFCLLFLWGAAGLIAFIMMEVEDHICIHKMNWKQLTYAIFLAGPLVWIGAIAGLTLCFLWKVLFIEKIAALILKGNSWVFNKLK